MTAITAAQLGPEHIGKTISGGPFTIAGTILAVGIEPDGMPADDQFSVGLTVQVDGQPTDRWLTPGQHLDVA